MNSRSQLLWWVRWKYYFQNPTHCTMTLCYAPTNSVEPDSPAIMTNQVLASLHCRIAHYGTRRNQPRGMWPKYRLIMSWNDYGDCWRWIWLGGASQCHSCFSLENYNRLSSHCCKSGRDRHFWLPQIILSVRPCWVSCRVPREHSYYS